MRRLVMFLFVPAVCSFALALLSALSPSASHGPIQSPFPSSRVVYAGVEDCFSMTPDDTCLDPFDTTLTGALRVQHRHVGSGRDVEPDTGDTWLVTITWKTLSTSNFCPCEAEVITATVAADWNGSTWTPSCTGCNPTSGPLWGVQVCGAPQCGALSSEYIILLDIDELKFDICQDVAFLHAVEFESISLDDGDVFTRVPCTELLAVSPINQPYYAVDLPDFRCPYTCTHANLDVTIPLVTIYYQ